MGKYLQVTAFYIFLPSMDIGTARTKRAFLRIAAFFVSVLMCRSMLLEVAPGGCDDCWVRRLLEERGASLSLLSSNPSSSSPSSKAEGFVGTFHLGLMT